MNFAVKDPNTGAWYKKENGYDWEVRKRYWLTSADGGFHGQTIEGLKEWAKGWNPRSFDDFYWFQSPDANGTEFAVKNTSAESAETGATARSAPLSAIRPMTVML